MLNDIAFKQITTNYWHAAYGPFRVVMMKDSGYINATKLCMSGGKEYKNWSRLQSSQELIQSLEQHEALENTHNTFLCSNLTLLDGNVHICSEPSPPCKFIQTMNSTEVERLISGTYCHPLLIPHIACWISTDFALKVGKVVNNCLALQYKEQLAAIKKEITYKDEQLVQATDLLQAASVTIIHALQDTLQYKDQLTTVKEEITGKDKQLDEATVNVTHAHEQTMKLQVAVEAKEYRHKVWSNSHAFTMLHLHSKDSTAPYYTIRCRKTAMQRNIRKFREKYPLCRIIFRRENVANPINLYKRLKENYPKIILTKGNYCFALCDEERLLEMLAKLFNVIE